MKVLVAEDDIRIREGVTELLEAEGWTALAAADGKEALQRYEMDHPDFLILDIMMPGCNGYEVCREVRRHNQQIPILFLSAKSEEIDRVVGLELGADDFVSKPFGSRELISRVRAISRRILMKDSTTNNPAFADNQVANSQTIENVRVQDSKQGEAQKSSQHADNQSSNQIRNNGSNQKPSSFQLKELVVFADELRCEKNGQSIDLGPRDVDILRLLAERPGKVISRNVFFDECWGTDYAGTTRTLDQHVSQLRKKVEHDPKNPEIICTVHGVGYRFPGS